jgi:hypothetical protein
MKNIFLALSLVFTSSVFADSNDNFHIVKTSQTVTIDGDLSEWNLIPTTASFTNHQTGAQGAAGAFAQMMWDDNNLYLAFTVTDADITANYLNQDDKVFDNDDLIEMFFDFDGSETNYLELGVSATGVNYDYNIMCPGATGGTCGSYNANFTWDIAGLESKTIIDGTINNSSDVDNGYTVEIKIPLSSLSTMSGGNYTPVQQGTTWKGNLFKISYNTGAGTHAGSDYLSLSNFGSFGFHQPSKFATFTFGALSVGNDEIKNANILFQKLSENQYQMTSPEVFSARVFDTLGNVMFTKADAPQVTISTALYPKGVYFLETIQKGVKSVEKVIIK